MSQGPLPLFTASKVFVKSSDTALIQLWVIVQSSTKNSHPLYTYDPQTGKPDYLTNTLIDKLKYSESWIIRIDDKLINPDYLDVFLSNQ